MNPLLPKGMRHPWIIVKIEGGIAHPYFNVIRATKKAAIEATVYSFGVAWKELCKSGFRCVQFRLCLEWPRKRKQCN